ncbi:MAG: DUF1289 domain-containing protein [Phaeospirillum sp.]|nr:DUF1289 domain-containing protein [Phaeospirillum sp.]
MPHPQLKIFNSPCKSVCRIDDRFDWCAGCKRTKAEIKAWSTASDGQKQAILDRLPGRAAAEIASYEA